MGSLDSALRDIASNLVGAIVSTSITVTRSIDPNYDPTSGEELAYTISTYIVKSTPPENYKKHEINGSSIQQNDLRIYIPAKNITIAPEPRTDTVTIDGVLYSIVSVVTHKIDLPILYELQLRT